MVVLIPSYRRTNTLPHVVQSVLNADVSNIEDRILILIVNNYYPNQMIVDNIVGELNLGSRFTCKVIHRKETMIALESWFEALFSIAYEDEVVFLLGDDDILLPWGLKNRYHQIKNTQSDMLISDFYKNLVFFQSSSKYYFDSSVLGRSSDNVKTPIEWDYQIDKHPESSFISNHCYRNTTSLRRGYKAAMGWGYKQSYAPQEFSTGNCPLYMPYAIKLAGGRVFSMRQKNVIRGRNFEETLYQEYADGGNTSFYALLIYDTFFNTLSHQGLAEFKEISKRYKNVFICHVISIAFNANISFEVFFKAIRETGISLRALFSKYIFCNIFDILREIPFFKSYGLKRYVRQGRLKSTSGFIKFISKL